MYCVTMGVNRRAARYKKATSRFMSAFVHLLAIVDFGSDIAFVIVSLHSPRFVDLIDGVDGCAGRSTDNSSRIQAVGAAFLALSSIVFAVKLYRDAFHVRGRVPPLSTDTEAMRQQRRDLLHSQLGHVFWLGFAVFLLEDIPFLALQVIYNSTVGFEISVTNIAAVVSTLITLVLHIVTFGLVVHFRPNADQLLRTWEDDSWHPTALMVKLLPLNDPQSSKEWHNPPSTKNPPTLNPAYLMDNGTIGHVRVNGDTESASTI